MPPFATALSVASEARGREERDLGVLVSVQREEARWRAARERGFAVIFD